MPIGSITTAGAVNLDATQLGVKDFLKILLTQLTYQDPLKPVDNQEFMAQMAQFTTLAQTQQLNDRIATLVSNQASLQSVGLLGKTVDFNTPGGQLTGAVTSLSLAGDSPVLTIKTANGSIVSNVSLGDVLSVR
jgi:flagellar basal-body rod modification protein FlgD